jgi:hypothetical protein
LNELARGDGCSRPYVSSLIRLAYLAPDITRAIVDGAQPAQLTLADLMTRDIRSIGPSSADVSGSSSGDREQQAVIARPCGLFGEITGRCCITFGKCQKVGRRENAGRGPEAADCGQ